MPNIKDDFPELTDLYLSKQVQQSHKQKEYFKIKHKKEPMTEPEPKPTNGIAINTYCNAKGVGMYVGVDLDTGEILFKSKEFSPVTHNIIDFMGIGHSLMYVKKSMEYKPIYSNSEISIGWISNNKCNSDMINTDQNAIDNCGKITRWLVEQKHLVEVKKWSTEKWGFISNGKK